MRRLIAAADHEAFAEDKIMTSIVSANALASGSSLSRAHAGRKLAAAEAIGVFGNAAQVATHLGVETPMRSSYARGFDHHKIGG
ncbi:hypothetical protein [Rhodopseudomonas palustris]|uniref:Uncharacterized protein n=1 Tax=Rhodopseudomonas palustris (strain ATCC BAA-98 / CGA009) TaxID=258594 RepID=Q6N792_RHOPA|nr:hypothetical protein [Rhodopseudomonas palustris]OPF90366.1 hypothetical protein B1S06_23645 [Rhodopseudomonas palustris]PPQ41419.1 hypothetical protein CKO39_21735 [Rhodopseudomonas palustris]QQM03887.1 hypothetical protein I8G32_02430 [Rhodopseudomonas palustris]RJF61951.1 hypothetical protein D4Q71_19595 [Rhodopseudomonas palustris]WAB80024.1 hypothetical protein OR798_12235 [Rhodopseudomonas palustris]